MPDKIRVLYIDDEPVLRKIARVFLEQSGNFSVEPIDSALAALDLLHHEKFDAIISDYKMPGMKGKKIRTLFWEEYRGCFSPLQRDPRYYRYHHPGDW